MVYQRLCNFSLWLTSLVVFTVWYFLIRVPALQSNNPIIFYVYSTLLGIVFAYGFFNLVLKIMMWFAQQFLPIKKWLFASAYVEGIWVGYYKNLNKEVILYFETIEQTVENTTIFGESYFLTNLEYKGSWKSIETYINPIDHSLTYHYSTSMVNADDARGTTTYNFLPNGKKQRDELYGYSMELNCKGQMIQYGKKLHTINFKIDKKQILKEAREYYNQSIADINTIMSKE